MKAAHQEHDADSNAGGSTAATSDNEMNLQGEQRNNSLRSSSPAASQVVPPGSGSMEPAPAPPAPEAEEESGWTNWRNYVP
mmetsp:Transcript_10642/g.26032  ORF Transcript_10642/g.26032 Transcript_10642/m.26032 type:complete len:81 (-) Transcript_10642:896-1138(-)